MLAPTGVGRIAAGPLAKPGVHASIVSGHINCLTCCVAGLDAERSPRTGSNPGDHFRTAVRFQFSNDGREARGLSATAKQGKEWKESQDRFHV